MTGWESLLLETAKRGGWKNLFRLIKRTGDYVGREALGIRVQFDLVMGVPEVKKRNVRSNC